MKKRVLSLFLTFVLSFSMMPMSAFAEGTGAVAEQEAQSSGDTAYVSTTGEDVSGGDAANEDASNKDTAVEAAQALIDALPEEVTAENADELQAQLMAIDEALAELSEEQAAGLDMTHYEKICAALNAPALVAEQDGEHDHDKMKPWTETTSLPNTAGSYYLTDNVTLTAEWEPKSGTVLCLNGKSITLNAMGDVINMSANGTIFTLYDCQKSGTITHGKDSTDTTYNGCGVVVGGHLICTAAISPATLEQIPETAVECLCLTEYLTCTTAKSLITPADQAAVVCMWIAEHLTCPAVRLAVIPAGNTEAA